MSAMRRSMIGSLAQQWRQRCDRDHALETMPPPPSTGPRTGVPQPPTRCAATRQQRADQLAFPPPNDYIFAK
jgi:hypothetical protein